MESTTVKKLFITCLIVLSMLLNSCNNGSVYEFPNENVSYQLYTNKDDVVRIVRTNGFGSYKLQIITYSGEIIHSEIIDTRYSFALTYVGKNMIELSYFVSRSDLKLFLPWFTKNTANPRKIGNYKIVYKYIMDNGFGELNRLRADSIHLNSDKNVSVFLKGKEIAKLSMIRVFLYKNKLSTYDMKTLDKVEYSFSTKDASHRYLGDIWL